MFLRRPHIFHSISKTRTMFEGVTERYEEAIFRLNGLQTNMNVLKNATLNVPSNNNAAEKLERVNKYLIRSGVSMNELNKMPVLHVSGTKGKGSTCAFCENILRHHGYKTGFFSSPHLIEVRERIRINGLPVSKDVFSKCFSNIYNSLYSSKESDEDMPFYFQFLFIMAVHLFLQQNVDVAIVEVGIGGEYDPTNIVTNVPVAGITSLGFDHISVLGNTIESIAWNKAGIMKQGSQVYTVNQPENAYKVLLERSIEKKCSLTCVHEINHFSPISRYPLSIQTNISLAIKLAEAWMSLKPKYPNQNSLVNIDVLKHSIESCQWPGRFEIRQEKNIRYYIDGAHTLESMSLCLNWYLNDIRNRKEKRALIFNLTGGRSCDNFFSLLFKGQFETVMFVPNVASMDDNNADSVNMVLPSGEQLSNCYRYREKWMKLVKETIDVQVFPCVLEAINYLEQKGQYNLLVTGSLHLVGAVSSLLNPSLSGTLLET